MYKCEECNLEFETFQAKANHHRWKHLKYAFKSEETRKKTVIKFSQANDRRFGGKYIEENIKCLSSLCNNIIHVKYRKGNKLPKTFCCKSCANKIRIQSPETRLKRSNSVKLAWKKGLYDTVSYHEKQNKNNKFSSKQEREIVFYFKTKYPEQEWTCGGGLKYKDELISRDLYSNKLKICFEYDGIWHFEDIKGQLKKKQRKDKLLEEWCKEYNYRLIRIDENDYKDFQQIEELFKRNEPIIKIGKRY